MFSRTQFLAKTGMSRKALRVYEQKKLLSPKLNEKGAAFFSSEDVKIGQLIRELRQARFSIEDIRDVLSATPENAHNLIEPILDKITRQIHNLNNTADHLNQFFTQKNKAPFPINYGGFWSFGITRTVRKNDVCNFINYCITKLDEDKVTSDQITVHYGNENSNWVEMHCYRPIPDNRRNAITADLRKEFVCETRSVAVLAKGHWGRYDCFDNSYDALNEVKGFVTERPVEIYTNYEFASVHRPEFEALIIH